MTRITEPMRPSPFNDTELNAWRARLIAARREAADDHARIAADSDVDGESSQASDTLDAAQTFDESLATAENAEALLLEIDRALRKIDRSDPCPYGICELTGEKIERERLELMPWTPYCASAASRAETA
jgi:RNA polymerase-binding transcription factor DksA